MPTVLIADDEPVILKVLQRFLTVPGRTVLTAASASEALRLAREQGPVDVALLDKNLGDASGLELARALLAAQPDCEIILVTAYASLESAIEAVQIGAYDYVTKPIDNFEGLELKVSNALQKVRLAREHAAMAAQVVESEARYRQLFDSAPDAMLAFDVGGARVLEANQAATALFGYPRSELLGLEVARLFGTPPPGAGARSDAWAGYRGLQRCLTRTGEIVPVEISPGDLQLDGRPMRSLVIRDVRERERMEAERRHVEEQLRHAQKMDAVGRLAGGLGHDLGNMLAVVLSYLEDVAPRCHGSLREDLETVITAADRASHLVRQLMTLTRKGPSLPVVLSVNDAVADLAKLLGRSLGEGIVLQTELSADLWPVRIDATQLGQVLLNLAVNARDAMLGGGVLRVTTENVTLRAGMAGQPLGLAGDHVAITVADTGVGMSPEVRERIFEPFFTTKERGKGTGLGLAVTYGIVAQARGSIAVESDPGHGTTFRVLLPRAKDAPARAAPPAVSSLVPQGRKRALVVEDEAPLRTIMVRALAAMGLQVVEGGSGEEGLRAAEVGGGRLDLLVSDLVLPGMAGTEVARAVLQRHGGCRVLLVTACPSDQRVSGVLERGGQVLLKPFRQAAFAEKVQMLLSA